MDPEQLRAFARRDWSLLRDLKRRFWLERRLRLGPGEGLRAADELRRHAHRVRPHWPTDAARAADLHAHMGLAAKLTRAAQNRQR